MKKKLTAAMLAGLVAFPMLGMNAEQASAATSIGVVTLKTNVNLREGKSTSSHVIRVLPKGSKWKVYAHDGGYYSLGGSRYITDSPKYVVSGNVTINQTVSSPTSSTGVVTLKTNVNLRNGKSLSSHVIKVLPKGSKWKVYGKSDGYYSLGGSRYITASSKYVVDGSVTIPTSTPSSNLSVKEESTSPTSGSATIDFAKKFMGVPYVWGGSSPSGFDCSGFIYYVLKNTGHNVSRLNAASYWNQYPSTSNPQIGDLVFFKNTYKPGISHVGFYIGNGDFIHASTSKGVTISNVNTSYYKQHFAGYKSVR